MIDLRSDTVTKPSDKMRAAMAAAEVGDDVFGEDPTVNRLQERAAEIFEKEAALFVPTGSMGNEIAVKLHTKPGQEIVIEERGHVLNYELGAAAVISGVTIRPVKSGDGSGHLTWEEIEPALHIDQPYYSRSDGSDLSREHAQLRRRQRDDGGALRRCLLESSRRRFASSHGRAADIQRRGRSERSVADLTRHCDSVMFTLSKGLGAPAGSILLGTERIY